VDRRGERAGVVSGTAARSAAAHNAGAQMQWHPQLLTLPGALSPEMLRLGLLPGVEGRGRLTNLVVVYSARRRGSVRQQALEKPPAPVAESCPPDSLSLECVARLLIPVSAFPWIAVKDRSRFRRDEQQKTHFGGRQKR
jgi:hypothetical protein